MDDNIMNYLSEADIEVILLEQFQELGYAHLPNKEKVPLAISPAQLLFGVDREAYNLALNACREAEPEEEVA